MSTLAYPAIVVVDDDPDVRWALARILRHIAPAYTVHSCSSGKDALNYIAQHRVCCVVTDNFMSGMKGLMLAQEITTQWPLIAVVLLTGTVDDTVQEAARAAGCLTVLNKPASLDTLRAAIAPLL